MAGDSSPITPLTPAQVDAAQARADREVYPERVAVEADMTLAALFGAKQDTTISADAAIAAVEDKGFKGWYGRTMSRLLDFFQKDHGAKAVAGDIAHAEAAAESEEKSGIG